MAKVGREWEVDRWSLEGARRVVEATEGLIGLVEAGDLDGGMVEVGEGVGRDGDRREVGCGSAALLGCMKGDLGGW